MRKFRAASATPETAAFRLVVALWRAWQLRYRYAPKCNPQNRKVLKPHENSVFCFVNQEFEIVGRTPTAFRRGLLRKEVASLVLPFGTPFATSKISTAMSYLDSDFQV